MPIIVASARHQEAEKISLLDAGADDYLTKPFGVSELLARIRVALRHRGTTLQPATTRYVRGDLLIDVDAYRVERDGRPLHLTPTEFKLAARLVRAGGRVVTHRQLLADVWGAEHVHDTHYLRLYMGQLRAKLEADAVGAAAPAHRNRRRLPARRRLKRAGRPYAILTRTLLQPGLHLQQGRP